MDIYNQRLSSLIRREQFLQLFSNLLEVKKSGLQKYNQRVIKQI